MMLNIRGVLRPHGGIQGAEIGQTASPQRLRVSPKRFLVHEQHIFARSIHRGAVSCGQEITEQFHCGYPAVIARKIAVLCHPRILHLIWVIFCVQRFCLFKTRRQPFLPHAFIEAVYTVEEALNAVS